MISRKIPQAIQSQIADELRRIERQHAVTIIYAVESGSRAWGFASQDSDYDVRFIYVHRPEWYLSIHKQRDVIERPITDELDMSGWDLQKTLRLLQKSNPPLLEKLQSPIVYREIKTSSQRIKDLVAAVYSPRACMHHYYSMAESNYKTYLLQETVWLKKYFYVLRPILACQWIARDLGPVPMEFEKLLDAIIPEGVIREQIENLLQIKRAGLEKNKHAPIPQISDYLSRELKRLAALKDLPASNQQTDILDKVFLTILQEIHPSFKL